jgi:hypothetical protein
MFFGSRPPSRDVLLVNRALRRAIFFGAMLLLRGFRRHYLASRAERTIHLSA